VSPRAKLPKLNLRSEPVPPPVPAPSAAPSAPAVPDRSDRSGKKIIAGHFPKATWAELRRLAVDHEKTAQELLEEALTDLFAKYRRNL